MNFYYCYYYLNQFINDFDFVYTFIFVIVLLLLSVFYLFIMNSNNAKRKSNAIKSNDKRLKPLVQKNTLFNYFIKKTSTATTTTDTQIETEESDADENSENYNNNNDNDEYDKNVKLVEIKNENLIVDNKVTTTKTKIDATKQAWIKIFSKEENLKSEENIIADGDYENDGVEEKDGENSKSKKAIKKCPFYKYIESKIATLDPFI